MKQDNWIKATKIIRHVFKFPVNVEKKTLHENL